MPHSVEGEAFLARVAELPKAPGINLDNVLKPSIDEEQELRRLFAQDKTNLRLENPHVGLVDVFGPNTEVIRKTRTRVVMDEEDLSARYLMPLKDNQRRKEGEASMVENLDEFKKNWSIFTEGSLSQLFDWSNVVAAGGAVISALLPLPEESKASKRAIRKYYHSAAYPTSDVDLFLWGLTPEQAEKKIITIYEAVRDSVPWDVTCIRTKHTVSIHSQYPYRSVQIVLRLYRSPGEILAGFDIDAPCCIYDGEHVWANPRAIIAMMRQCNTVDVTRRSPSYEVRLAKYSKRGFEVYVPNLIRKNIDPTIYERSIAKIEGLARLIVLEKLLNADSRYQFLESRRELRGRPFALRRPGGRRRRKYKGDLKTDIGGLEVNDYDVATLHIPYGPGWDARKIERLVYQTDLGMNSTFNPKNKGRRLHRHPAFFGTIDECMGDCCEHCPDPIDEDERNLQKEEDEKYIRDRIAFIEENPGRQSLSGSFNPIDEGEWSEQVYVRPLQRLFNAIVAHDRDAVKVILEEGKVDLQNRDHVGRTALHVAILVKDTDIAGDLVDAGCRMIARLVDGRTALHLAAQYDLHELIAKMMIKSKENAEAAKKKEKESRDDDEDMQVQGPPDTTTETERPSSEDDWSSDERDGKEDDDSMDVDDDGGKDGEDYDHCGVDSDGAGAEDHSGAKADRPDGEVPEDEEDEPDVLDISAGDWDQGFKPLCYALLYASRATVDILLKNDADPNEPAISQGNFHGSNGLLPLFLTLLRDDEDIAVEIAERLIEAGASSSSAGGHLMTIVHHAIFARRVKVLDMLLKKDPGAKKALNFPSVKYGSSKFPVVSAIEVGNYAALATLLAHGVKINPSGADVTLAKTISGNTADGGQIWGYNNVEDYSTQIYQPVETALTRSDYIVDLLVELGAEVNIGLYNGRGRWAQKNNKKTVLDWVVDALENVIPQRIKTMNDECTQLEEKANGKSYSAPAAFNTWNGYLSGLITWVGVVRWNSGLESAKKDGAEKKKAIERIQMMREYLMHVKSLLVSRGAKSWEEIYGAEPEPPTNQMVQQTPLFPTEDIKTQPKPRYIFISKGYRRDYVQQDSNERYDELFEAAFRGDDAKIEKLCVPSDESDGPTVPIQITVEALTEENSGRTGISPLFAAIAGKRWNTARLIMAIAAAQYHDEDDENEQDLRVALFDLVDEEEDETMSDNDSNYSDDTIGARKRQTKFLDIAKKISVKTNVHPSTFLEATISHPTGSKIEYSTLIMKAVREDDFEAFVNLFNIYDSTYEKEEYPQVFQAILQLDRVQFLDEYIRRTGVGIDIDTIRQTVGEDHPAILNDQNRLYLGLNIRGKKRADLARKGDPSHNYLNKQHTPLVWEAVDAGAKLIVEYLASEKPLAAYKYFAANGKGDRAEWLRHSKGIGTALNEWLGWMISPLGESPLTIAVFKNKQDVLSTLFVKSAKLMKSALHQKLKFLGFNALLLAANRGCDKEMFDFVLKKGVSPLESDQIKGWNMYHWLCFGNNGDLLEYLLERLPHDISEQLLAQRSKGKLNTPLQIAVKAGYIRPVKLILGFTREGLVTYDAHGFTPLHNAVRRGYQTIVDEIVKVFPKEGLYLENGVGKTAFEDAEKRALKPLTEGIITSDPSTLKDPSSMRPWNSETTGRELQKALETMNQLISNGTLEKGALLANALEKFVSAMEGRLAKVKAKETVAGDNEVEKNKDPVDTRNCIGTFKSIGKAVAGNEAERRLIHLKDVQLSVARSLEEVYREERVYVDRDGFEEAEIYDNKEAAKGVVTSYISLSGDTC